MDGNWKPFGVMFLAETVSDMPPHYFGAFDVWHRHENLVSAPAETLLLRHRRSAVQWYSWRKTAYQLHVWVEPGGTCGVFAHDYSPIAPGAFPGATMPAASELRAQVRQQAAAGESRLLARALNRTEKAQRFTRHAALSRPDRGAGPRCLSRFAPCDVDTSIQAKTPHDENARP